MSLKQKYKQLQKEVYRLRWANMRLEELVFRLEQERPRGRTKKVQAVIQNHWMMSDWRRPDAPDLIKDELTHALANLTAEELIKSGLMKVTIGTEQARGEFEVVLPPEWKEYRAWGVPVVINDELRAKEENI